MGQRLNFTCTGSSFPSTRNTRVAGIGRSHDPIARNSTTPPGSSVNGVLRLNPRILSRFTISVTVNGTSDRDPSVHNALFFESEYGSKLNNGPSNDLAIRPSSEACRLALSASLRASASRASAASFERRISAVCASISEARRLTVANRSSASARARSDAARASSASRRACFDRFARHHANPAPHIDNTAHTAPTTSVQSMPESSHNKTSDAATPEVTDTDR